MRKDLSQHAIEQLGRFSRRLIKKQRLFRRRRRLQLLIPVVGVVCCVAVASSTGESEDREVQRKYLTARPLNPPSQSEEPGFTRIDGSTIGIDFQNRLDDENIRNYFLNGAGMTVGDVDSNGLPDLYLASQDGPSKLFLQTEPWTFIDHTEASGFKDKGLWGSGAAFVDINNDGHLDLYVCNKGAHDQIFMNNGDGRFGELPGRTGDASLRATTMVAFSDYDQDGDLDFYLTATRLYTLSDLFGREINIIQNEDGEWIPHPKHNGEFVLINGHASEVGTFDQLLINDSDPVRGGYRLRDVTREAGIVYAREHGLGAVWWDYNNDNKPDLSVANDFFTQDHLYHNNGDGTFGDRIEDSFPYISWFSMGNDFADINNDGWIDYLSTDMSPTTHFKQKSMMGAMSDSAWFLDNLEPRQYMRNAMQVNTGTGKFIDVAFHAGIDSTDWTWAGLFGDLDNDGFEDLYFMNGIERNVQDTDLSNRMNELEDQALIDQMMLDAPRLAEANLAFRNKGDLTFENVTDAWGMSDLSVSQSGVLFDLDRDGDLDIVVNNCNEPVGIYRNNSDSGHALLVSLLGIKSNRFGLGARVEVELPGGQTLTRMMTSSRGYMSGVEPVLHFGLGNHATVESLTITWPSGRVQTYSNLESGFHYTVTETDEAPPPADQRAEDVPEPLFTAAGSVPGIDFTHKENEYNDFAAQPLLPNRLSTVGPAMAVGDANGDGLPDLYFGAAAGFEAELHLLEKDGSARKRTLPFTADDKHHEDVAATWFDSDGDGDLDLYVVSGGASEPDQAGHYLDRLYLNDGSSGLQRAPTGTIPELKNSGSCVAPCDFDGDGDTDLFVGSRHVPKRYPTEPASSLLINDGGRFTKADSPVNSAGMVTDATWADIDGDGRPDLIVSTEWGPVRIFRNTDSGMVEITEQAGLRNKTGWWMSVAAGDFDQDGDMDLIAGNFGSNTKYHVYDGKPAVLFASDFGDQGQLQLVEAKYAEGKLLPIRGRSCSTTAMPHLKEVAPTYTDFACLSLPELYTEDSLDEAIKLEATTLKSTLFRNDGEGRFTANPLPMLAQIAPVMDIALGDFNSDGITDAALGQNFNDAQRETGRMNAGLGVILQGSGDGTFTELWPQESGFYQRTNLRDIEAVDLNQDGLLDLISANNGESPTLHFGQPRK